MRDFDYEYNDELNEEAVIEEVQEVKEPVEPKKRQSAKKGKTDVNSFIERKLKVINEMSNEAKAQEASRRLFRNK